MTTLHEKPIVFEDNSELHLSHNEDTLMMKIDSNNSTGGWATVAVYLNKEETDGGWATVAVYLNKEETESLYRRLHKVIQRSAREDRNF